MHNTSERTHWLLVFIALSAGIAAAIGVGKVAPLMPVMREALGLSLAQGGAVVSSFMVLSMLTALPASLLILRVGVYRGILVSLALLAVGGCLTGLAVSFEYLLLARMIEGLGYIGVAVSGPGLVVAAANDHDRQLAMGIWAAWIPLGVGSVMLLTPMLLQMVNWQSVWLVLAVYPLLLIAVIGVSFSPMRKKLSTRGPLPTPKFRTMLSRGPVLATIGFGCFSSMYIVVLSFTPTLWTETLGISLPNAAVFTAVAVVLSTPGSIMGGWLLQRGVRFRVLIMVGFMFPTLAAAAIFVPNLPGELQGICVLLFMVFSTLIPGIMFGLAPRFARIPQEAPLVIGIMLHGITLGQFSGPVLFGGLIDFMNGQWAYGSLYFLFLLCIGSTTLFILARHLKEKGIYTH